MIILAELQKQCEAMQQQLADFARRLATQRLSGQDDADQGSSAFFENLFTEDMEAEVSIDTMYGEPIYDEYPDDDEVEEHNDLDEEEEGHHLPHPDTDQDDHEVGDDEFDEEVIEEDEDDDGVILRDESIYGINCNVVDRMKTILCDGETKPQNIHTKELSRKRWGINVLDHIEVFGRERQAQTSAINIQHQHLTRRIWDPGAAGVDSRTSPFQPGESDAGAWR